MALKSGDQLLLLLFVSYVSLTMISCPGNVFARVISGRCEAGHYRQQNKGWWTRSAINIPPLEFLNLHQYEKNQNENPYGLCLNVLKTLVGPFCKEKVHVSAFSQYFVYGCQYRRTLISTVMRPVCKLLCAEARVSPG